MATFVPPLIAMLAVIAAIIAGGHFRRRRQLAQATAKTAQDRAVNALKVWNGEVDLTDAMSDMPVPMKADYADHLRTIAQTVRPHVSRYRSLGFSGYGDPANRHGARHYHDLASRYDSIANGLEQAVRDRTRLLDQINSDKKQISQKGRASRFHDVKRKLARYQIVVASCSKVFVTDGYQQQLDALFGRANALAKTLSSDRLETVYLTHRQLEELEHDVYGLDYQYRDIDVAREQILGANRSLWQLVRRCGDAVRRLGFDDTSQELNQLADVAASIDSFIKYELAPNLPDSVLIQRLSEFTSRIRDIENRAATAAKSKASTSAGFNTIPSEAA